MTPASPTRTSTPSALGLAVQITIYGGMAAVAALVPAVIVYLAAAQAPLFVALVVYLIAVPWAFRCYWHEHRDSPPA